MDNDTSSPQSVGVHTFHPITAGNKTTEIDLFLRLIKIYCYHCSDGTTKFKLHLYTLDHFFLDYVGTTCQFKFLNIYYFLILQQLFVIRK